MGYTHLVYIYESVDLQKAEHSEQTWKELCPEIGDAILTVCIDPETKMVPRDGVLREVRKTDHRVGNKANAVNFCDRVHAGQVEVYGWSGNRLSHIEDLHDDEIRDIFEEVTEEMRRRGLQPGSNVLGDQASQSED